MRGCRIIDICLNGQRIATLVGGAKLTKTIRAHGLAEHCGADNAYGGRFLSAHRARKDYANKLSA